MALSDQRATGALALIIALLPDPAAAHAPIPGWEGFYVGLLHPVTSPAQVAALIALGLVFGQRWPGRFALAWAMFAVACLIGILLGQMGLPIETADLGLLALAVVTGILATLWPAAPLVLGVAAAAAAVAGVLIGLASTPDPGALRATVITLAGSLVGAVLALLYAAGGFGWLYERATMAWARIGFRITAAWTAAIAALLLALRFSASG